MTISYSETGKGPFGNSVPKGGLFRVSDQIERDSRLKATKPTGEPDWPVENSASNIQNAQLPRFRPR